MKMNLNQFSFRNYSNITIKSVGTFCYISGGINTSVDADSTDSVLVDKESRCIKGYIRLKAISVAIAELI